MTINMLIEQNSIEEYCLDIEITNNTEIMSCSLIDSEKQVYKEDVLYFGPISQINKQEILPQNYVCWLDNDDLIIQAQPGGFDRKLSRNRIVVAADKWLKVYNQLIESCMRSLKNENDYAQMIHMTLQGRPLSAILDFAFERLQNEIVVIDVSGKLLGHTSVFEIPDKLWMTSIKKGYCSYEFMEHIKSERFKVKRPITDIAFESECYQDHLKYLSSMIIIDQQLVGYVFMIQNRQVFNRACSDMLPYVSRAAGYYIKQRYGGDTTPFHIHHSVISDVLAGMSPRHIEARIQIGDIKFPERMCVLVIKSAYYRSESDIKKRLTEELTIIFKKALYIYYEESLVFIVPVDETLHLMADHLDALTKLAEKEHLKIGKSNGFTQVIHLRQYYEEACDAIKIAKELNLNKDFVDFQTVSFYHLLEILPTDSNLMKYVHPSLKILKQYDSANGTHLFETLNIYTMTGFNQKETANQMFLHRNSLIYRMKRIEEIAGLNLKSPELLFHLMVAFQIDTYLSQRLNP